MNDVTKKFQPIVLSAHISIIFIMFFSIWLGLVFAIPRGFAPTPFLNVPSFLLLSFLLFHKKFTAIGDPSVFVYGIGLAYIVSIYFNYTYYKFFEAIFGVLKLH